jgi:hypothetical protein
VIVLDSFWFRSEAPSLQCSERLWYGFVACTTLSQCESSKIVFLFQWFCGRFYDTALALAAASCLSFATFKPAPTAAMMLATIMNLLKWDPPLAYSSSLRYNVERRRLFSMCSVTFSWASL